MAAMEVSRALKRSRPTRALRPWPNGAAALVRRCSSLVYVRRDYPRANCASALALADQMLEIAAAGDTPWRYRSAALRTGAYRAIVSAI